MDEFFCFFCGGGDVRLAYFRKFHRLKPDHGPFDFYVCADCGSGLTLPPPDPATLAALYASFEFGLSKPTRELLAENPTAVWHDTCLRRLIMWSRRGRDTPFTWFDVGAGAGEIALRFAQYFPASKGVAIDIHDCPPDLIRRPENLQWRRINISCDLLAAELPVKADLVFAIGVWEHVRRPDLFARNLLSLVNPKGVLYIETPNYASLARRLMGSYWPYFLPGEHLCIPTPKGARICLARQFATLNTNSQLSSVVARPILLQYSARFVLTKFSMPGLAHWLPPKLSASLPSGAMECVAQLGGATARTV